MRTWLAALIVAFAPAARAEPLPRAPPQDAAAATPPWEGPPPTPVLAGEATPAAPRPPPIATGQAPPGPPAEPARRGPVLGIGPDGFYLGTVDSGFQLRLRGVVQSDGRAYVDGGADAPPDTFLVRRARLYIEGTVGKAFEFRVLPDFAGGQLQLLDAWVSVRVLRWLQVRSGKMKSRFGLERSQAEQALVFVERGLPSAIAPDRDVGVILRGEILQGTIAYEGGVFNGVPDGASGDLDARSGKDLEARVFAHPFRPLHTVALHQLGLGVAVTYGRQEGTASSPALPRYVTAGQQPFFGYRAEPGATAFADGARLRWSPQLSWYFDRLGVLAEYVTSRQRVTLGASGASLLHQAWQVEASLLVTPDHAAFNGVVPSRPFDLDKGQLGAVELAARIGALLVDGSAFPTYADPARAARRAVEWAAALNWYFTRNVRLGLMFARTTFAGGAPTGDRAPEHALLERLQVAF